ncbi:TonB-dependent receptor [Pseudoalteromonas sp. NEC-BIFX-2020_002]|uniref:TonB-dependent receptor n=1 Tax=Pseudoalteromonas sp. NEC-BIFX-2020_002 TaxID=2732353 RepID=UPI001476FBA6|nr:TonB-dependent receptor [Pseudoalteromonas sp. NEC-BIFX-2020_002]NNG41561.1 TonB-dependent receptor [Pseudoalteromonas sp. NEC-BIFX-2020_002]
MIKTNLSILALIISAQVTANDEPQDLERILVTGSRIAESIDEIPSSVTIIGQKELAAQLKVTTDLQSILAMYVPGIASSSGTSSNFAQTLRGRAALVMIDGVPQSTPLRNGSLGMRSLDPHVIERIEVIQGATSIYGNGAAGGIINYITKKPATNSKFSLNTTASTQFSAVKLDDSAGLKVTTTASGEIDDFSYIVSLGIENNGVLRDAEGDALGTQYGLSEAKSRNFFTKLSYDFDADKSLQMTYNYFESQQDSAWVDVIGDINKGEKTYAIKDAVSTPFNAAPQGPRGNHNLQIKYTDAEIFSNTAFNLDVYKQSIENVFFYSTVLANPDLNLAGGQSLIKSEKQGLRSVFNTLADWDNVEATFIYGVDILNDTTSQPMVDGRLWVPEMDMVNVAGFLQSKWVIQDDFIVKAGLRYENMDIEVNDYNTLKLCRSADQCSVPKAVKGGTIEFTATTFNVGFRYNANQAFTPYVSYSQGANIPDLGALLRSATVQDIALIQTEAAIIDNYEVGFVSEFEQFRFELSAYKSFSDLGSRSVQDPKTGIYITQRAPQKIWGYEGVLNYTFNDQWDLAATYGYVEGKHSNTGNYLGAREVSAPKGTLALNWQPTTQAKMSVHYIHVSDRDRFEKNDKGVYTGDEGPVNGYGIVNLSGSYDFEQWSLFAGVENLLNKDYFPARSQALTFRAFNVKGIGTTVNLGINYRF